MPRLTPIISKKQVAAKDHAIADAIVKSRGGLAGPFSMFMYCPELASRVAHLGAYVRFEGKLGMRVRVHAAMVVAREYEAIYVWGAQSGAARRMGVAEKTITAIRENHSRGIPKEDLQIVKFTRDLLRKHRISTKDMTAIRKRLGNDELIELTGSIGYYSLLCMTVNACELDAKAGMEILKT